tara:strand:+ start:9942 stop:10253 length:312 start_codon:yes stop_codon:yes gene_type:complete
MSGLLPGLSMSRKIWTTAVSQLASDGSGEGECGSHDDEARKRVAKLRLSAAEEPKAVKRTVLLHIQLCRTNDFDIFEWFVAMSKFQPKCCLRIQVTCAAVNVC